MIRWSVSFETGCGSHARLFLPPAATQDGLSGIDRPARNVCDGVVAKPQHVMSVRVAK